MTSSHRPTGGSGIYACDKPGLPTQARQLSRRGLCVRACRNCSLLQRSRRPHSRQSTELQISLVSALPDGRGQTKSDGLLEDEARADMDSTSSIFEDPSSTAGGEESKGVQAALGALQWYKGTVSPLLPRSCRFLPTCSEYSMDAYKQFGVAKGTTLTAWRLLRCNPLNLKAGYQGKYDPPRWPPVGLEWAFRTTA